MFSPPPEDAEVPAYNADATLAIIDEWATTQVPGGGGHAQPFDDRRCIKRLQVPMILTNLCSEKKIICHPPSHGVSPMRAFWIRRT
jgi:hypothetical protein